MKKIESKIQIDAPKSLVWKVLMDFEAYPSWNSFIKKISGEPQIGNVLKVEIHPPGQQAMGFRPTILNLEYQREFRWKGKLFLKGVFDGEHYFILNEITDQRTELIHGEVFSGVLSSFILNKIQESTLAGFKAMNKELKSRSEQMAN